MRILILGGTAFLSSEIARQAVAAGHKVTCLARGSAAEPPAGTRRVKSHRSLGANSYADVVRDWDAVIDVARDPVPATEALAALAHGAGHWTVVSSCSVYADHSTPGDAEALNAVGDPVPFGDYVEESRTSAGYQGEVLHAPADWRGGYGIDYWSGPDSLPLWLPGATKGSAPAATRQQKPGWLRSSFAAPDPTAHPNWLALNAPKGRFGCVTC
ncbi:hypothetical protein [Arthrobacter sp. UYCo732]|uniref:hypothetical protein n=1 Tax=Arthrobacter sp. UYCo732 TaxID=3156336 RepID=UPI003397BA25